MATNERVKNWWLSIRDTPQNPDLTLKIVYQISRLRGVPSAKHARRVPVPYEATRTSILDLSGVEGSSFGLHYPFQAGASIIINAYSVESTQGIKSLNEQQPYWLLAKKWLY
jgi:hypothetical protein